MGLLTIMPNSASGFGGRCFLDSLMYRCVNVEQTKMAHLEYNNQLSATLEAMDAASILINSKGFITHANSLAHELFRDIHINLIGNHLRSILGNQPTLEFEIKNKNSKYKGDLLIKIGNITLQICSMKPINISSDKSPGFIFTFKKITLIKIHGQTGNIDDDGKTFSFDKIVGSSPQIMKTIELAKRIAPNMVNVLLQGESGTGKELFAQAIHYYNRPEGPFIAINCAAIPRSMIESELFGYVRGAFTDVDRNGKPGKFELANNGTLLLDEIGDMPLEIQPALLRVLEEKK